MRKITKFRFNVEFTYYGETNAGEMAMRVDQQIYLMAFVHDVRVKLQDVKVEDYVGKSS